MLNKGDSRTFVVNLYDDFGHVSTDVLKVCAKCGKAKDVLNFGVHSSRVSGLQSECRECKALIDKLFCAREKDSMSKRSKAYYSKNKESIKQRTKQYAIDNADSVGQRKREYFQKNKEKFSRYTKERAKIDPVYRTKISARKMIIKALNGQSKSKKTEEILGCSYVKLKEHIESLFEPWMNWDNKGLYNGSFNYGWDIDHIVPLCSAKSPEEVLSLNHYTNLRPLCSHVNRNIKRDKHE